MLCGMTIAPSMPMATTMLPAGKVGTIQSRAATAMSGFTMKISTM